MKRKHNLKRLTALCTALFVLAATLMALPLTASAEGVTVGDIVYTVNGASSADPSSPSGGETIVAKLRVSGQVATETDAVLISALYNDNVLTQVEVSKPGAAAQGADLETSITVPNTEGASWRYRSFVWNLTDTLTPYESTNALFLYGEGRVNAAYLAWDAVDGKLDEPLYVYKDGAKVSDVTIPAGKGEWAEYVVADGTTPHSYYVQNEDGTRKSNTVTVTPAKADELLKASAWATPAVHPEAPSSIIAARDETTAHDMIEPADHVFSYVPTTPVEKSDQSDPGYALDGTSYASGIATPEGEGHDESQKQYFVSPDGESVAWLLAPFWRQGWKTVIKDNNLALTATKSADANRYNASFIANEEDEKFSKDIRDFTILIEYWGTKTTDFKLHYATDKYPVLNTNIDNVTVKHDTFPITNTTAKEEWRAARKDIHNAYGGYIPSSAAFHWTNHFSIGSGGTGLGDSPAYIRKVIMVPTQEIDKAGGILPESLFITSDTVEDYNKSYVPTRAMRDLTQANDQVIKLTVLDQGVNLIRLAWDAMDGNVTDTLKVYRDGSEIATIESGMGDYVDYVLPKEGDDPAHTYQIKNENGARVSNTVTATPVSAAEFLNKSAWADANVHPDLITTKPAQDGVNYHNMTNNGGKAGTISKFWYEPASTKGSNADYSANTDFFNGGGNFANEDFFSPAMRAVGIATGDGVAYIPGESGPSKEQFFQSPDKKSAAWVLGLYTRGENTNKQLLGSANGVPFVVAPGGAMNRESVFDGSIADFKVFVEYWGTKTTPFKLNYAKTDYQPDPPPTNGWAAAVNIDVDANSEEMWKIASQRITNGYMGYVKPESQALQLGSQFDIGSGESGDSTEKKLTYIRKVMVVPTADYNDLVKSATVEPKALFLTTENQNEPQYKNYKPIRAMQAMVD